MTTLTTQLEALEKGGFSSEEISTWKQDKILTLENAGFNSDEIFLNLINYFFKYFISIRHKV